jgi:hypothetical protein
MADFKISRFRYTWKGIWNASTQYNRDDVIRYGGSSWVCRRQHTASLFASDQIFVPVGATELSPAWIKMTDGYAWRDQWQTATLYNPGDVVLYGGVLYLAANSHTSSVFDDNIFDWIVYGAQIAWTANWQANNRYSIGDLVKYGGIIYICTEGHQSDNEQTGLEADQEKWQIYYEGIEFRGDWLTNQRYRINDIVKFGGTLFRCKKDHTPGDDSTLNFDQDEFWEIELPGFQPSGTWNSTTVYQVGDVVRHGGYLFYSLTNNYSSRPTASLYQVEDREDPIDWLILSKGQNFRGPWSASTQYNVGDVVRRGGNLYISLIDTEISADGSSLDYLDSSNWELVTTAQNFRSKWVNGVEYAVNDLVIFVGDTYKCNFYHVSSDENFPGDNGSGVFYWDLVIKAAGANVGMKQRGDLLTFNLSRTQVGDGSTLTATNVPLSDVPGQLITVNSEDTVIYKDYGHLARVRYVSLDGVDDLEDPQRGVSPFKPWRTVRFACEQADDGFAGTTTVRVATGKFSEILPIIVPVRTAVVGSELRSTTIESNSAGVISASDRFYTLAALNRISGIVQAIIAGTAINPLKSPGNNLNPVILKETVTVNISFDPPQFDPFTGTEIYQFTVGEDKPLTTSTQASADIQTLIQNIISYINFYVNSTGLEPILTGSNTAVTEQSYLNSILVLEVNRKFLVEEVIRFVEVNYPSYVFDTELYETNFNRFIDAWKYDLLYTGNYKSLLTARYYRNAVLGSHSDDMFYLRDGTGLRNCTVQGLFGRLNPPNVFDLYRKPTGGSFVSLDPGWGPADNRTWIINRSPYVQGVTTIGEGCVGQKIDGALHSGGNRSIVSNDFTQVISDGIGAYVLNQGRAELVSVFSYYCHVGYLAENGGIIRAANGNNSYGKFGAIADGVDNTEIPRSATTNTRNQQALGTIFAGDFTDAVQIIEWSNAGQEYTQASASFVGSGTGASVLFEDFRDDAIFQTRILDTSTILSQSIGGGGYSRVQNNAQVHQTLNGDLTSITIAANDPNTFIDYQGMRIIITSGPGTGQYGYITAYDITTKVVSVSRESDDQPGWDHIIPGTLSALPLTAATSYRIEPRSIFSDPGFDAEEIDVGTDALVNDVSVIYGETTAVFTALTGQLGTGVVEGQDGLVPVVATFNVTKLGRSYIVTINNTGAGYAVGDTITILGTSLGGDTPYNDLSITVTVISNDSTNSILEFTYRGIGKSGNFVKLTNGNIGQYSNNGTDWVEPFNMPSSGEWKCLASGDNKFVAIRKGSNAAASSLNGFAWTARTMPSSRDWNSVVYGGDRFVAVAGNLNSAAYSTNGTTWIASTMPTIGDSTINEWIDITYGKNKFVALANSQNISAYSSDGITWEGVVMDSVADSSQQDWVSIAYGNNRFVAISSQGDVSWSFDAEIWTGGSMPAAVGSNQMTWKKLRYAQGVFFAVCEAEGGGTTAYAATSTDGIYWTGRELDSDLAWNSVAFGNPYIDALDSTAGKNTPIWIAVAAAADSVNKIRTGARAKGRAEVTAGVITEVKLWDTGSGYTESPTLTLVDPNNTADAEFENRLGDGVLSNPSWVNRGIGYRSRTTTVTVTGNGFADQIPIGKFLTLQSLEVYPSPGAQIIFDGNPTRYTLITVSPLGIVDRGLAALVRVSPELRVRDNLEHNTTAEIREKYSQCRITGHDFLDIGTGNFEETNYPELYKVGFFTAAPENEVVEEDGGRVFYTSTDQSGNFRTGELFAVEQATGIVTISADFFDLGGLTELRLGGIRVGGSGAVIREFSTDPLFTEDSNNIAATQRAIRAFLTNRLSLGGSEVAVGGIQAGQIVLGGPDTISNALSLKIVIPVQADFSGLNSGIAGSMLAQTMFFRSFNDQN